MSYLRLALVAILTTFLARPAVADLAYTFTTTSVAPLAGSLIGGFVVPDSAILDGRITASEMTSFSFRLPSATSPYVPVTFASPDILTIQSPFSGAISVDPITGEINADSLIRVTDDATGQLLVLTTFPGTVPPLASHYDDVIIASGQFALGYGVWSVQRTNGLTIPVPSLSIASLVALSLALILLARGYIARSRWRDASIGREKLM